MALYHQRRGFGGDVAEEVFRRQRHDGQDHFGKERADPSAKPLDRRGLGPFKPDDAFERVRGKPRYAPMRPPFDRRRGNQARTCRPAAGAWPDGKLPQHFRPRVPVVRQPIPEGETAIPAPVQFQEHSADGIFVHGPIVASGAAAGLLLAL